MDQIKGRVVGIKAESHLNRERPILEIELEKTDEFLFNWLKRKVVIKKIRI